MNQRTRHSDEPRGDKGVASCNAIEDALHRCDARAARFERRAQLRASAGSPCATRSARGLRTDHAPPGRRTKPLSAVAAADVADEAVDVRPVDRLHHGGLLRRRGSGLPTILPGQPLDQRTGDGLARLLLVVAVAGRCRDTATPSRVLTDRVGMVEYGIPSAEYRAGEVSAHSGRGTRRRATARED